MKDFFYFIILSTAFFNTHVSVAQVISYKQEIQKFRSENWKGLLQDPRTTVNAADSIFLNYYPIKEKNKVYCTVELLNDQKPFEMPTYSGMVKSFIRYAKFNFEYSGKKVSLIAYRNIQTITSPLHKDLLFIPFKDIGSGKQTYGGGRYMDFRIGNIRDGHALLDLNRVYNPWCAYSDGYNCPIPPAENHLPIKIKTGEKKFKKVH